MIDIIIIGCGPAGMSAALQLKRYGYSFEVFEKSQIGGLVKNANLIENYPGFPHGIRGTELIQLFAEQCRINDIKPVYEKVTDLDYLDDLFYIKTKQNYFRSAYAVIATGTEPRKLNLPNTENMNGRNIFYDIYEIMQVKDKNIAIIGSGDIAFDYALNLSDNNTVTVFNRSQAPKCIPILWERAKKKENLIYLNRSNLINIFPTESDRIKLEYYSNDEHAVKEGFFDYVIPAIGRQPANNFISERIYKNQNMLIKNGRLFFIGDFNNDICRQVAISAGDGIKTAMLLKSRIESTKRD